MKMNDKVNKGLKKIVTMFRTEGWDKNEIRELIEKLKNVERMWVYEK